MGIVAVAARAGPATSPPNAKITCGWRLTSSAARPGSPFNPGPGEPVLENDIPPLDILELAEALTECRQVGVVVRGAEEQHADAGHLPCRLPPAASGAARRARPRMTDLMVFMMTSAAPAPTPSTAPGRYARRPGGWSRVQGSLAPRRVPNEVRARERPSDGGPRPNPPGGEKPRYVQAPRPSVSGRELTSCWLRRSRRRAPTARRRTWRAAPA